MSAIYPRNKHNASCRSLPRRRKKNSRVIPSYYTPRIQAEEALAQTPFIPKAVEEEGHRNRQKNQEEMSEEL